MGTDTNSWHGGSWVWSLGCLLGFREMGIVRGGQNDLMETHEKTQSEAKADLDNQGRKGTEEGEESRGSWSHGIREDRDTTLTVRIRTLKKLFQ